ncbi:MAG: mechanosensitive ion channel family protein [Deltaproteobacteria bacterium]|nr:mechanosensitive ion channel family protein [Deltaproteobacteria bacterium]
MDSLTRTGSAGRLRAGLAFAVIALGAALAPIAAWSATPIPGLGADDEPPPPKKVPKERRTPRATMQTFIDSAVAASAEGKEHYLDIAAACLDLSDVPVATRHETGRDLAIKLKEAIDRIEFIDFRTVPDDPNGPPWTFKYIAGLEAEIVIAPNADGEWLFTAGTVARIEDLYAFYEDRPKVAGVGGSGMDLSPSLWLRSQIPPELRGRFLGLETWQWAGLVALLALAWIIARIARFVLRGPVQSFLDRRSLAVPKELVYRLLEPLGVVAMGILWVLGLRWLGLPPELAAVTVLVAKFIAAVGVVRFAFRAIDIVTHVLKGRAALTPSRFDDLIVPFFDKSAKVLVVALGIVFIADVFGISPASLLAGLGIGGLALALAAQDTVKNLFGSLTVILDRPFEIGDDVKIGGDIEGTVEHVGFRSTRVRTYEHTLITVPNGNLISANVDNLGKRNFRRYRAIFQLAMETDPKQVIAFCEGLRELVRAHPNTRKEGFHAGLFDIGAHSLDVLFICHFTVTDYAGFIVARHRLLLDVVTLASRLDVELAYPTRKVQVVPPEHVPKRRPLDVRTPEQHAEAEIIGKTEALVVTGTARPGRPGAESSD